MRFHHHAILTTDLAASEAFYVDLLGLEVVTRHEDAQGVHRATWVALEEGFLALERADAGSTASTPTTGHLCFVFAIAKEEREDRVRELQDAGFPVQKQTDFTFYVRDPDGAQVGFSHYPDGR